MSDDTRVRSALAEYAQTMSVDRPPLDEVLGSTADAPGRRPWLRPALAVAAAVLVVVGAVAVLRGDAEPPVMAGPSTLPVVWPLTDDVPAELLRTPESAAEAYLDWELGLPPEWRFEGDGETDLRTADRMFVLDGEDGVISDLRVWLVEVDGLWYVTAASFGDGPSITDARVVGDQVRLEVERAGDPALNRDADQLAVELRGDDGALLDELEVAMVDGRWQADLQFPADATPAAVLVRQDDEDGPAFASSIVLPAWVADHPANARFPFASGGDPYTAWVDTLTRPEDSGTDWFEALSRHAIAVSNGSPTDVTTQDVVIGPDGLSVSGRFTVGDGGTGTFELARLQDGGPWYLVSMVDDAFEVRDVSFTATEVRVTVAVAVDYDLAAGRALSPPPGKTFGEIWGKAGEEGVFVSELGSSGSAGVYTVYEAVEGRTLLRFYDAWARPAE